ncbi:MAG: peptidoglycan-binding domain-containing protein [Patescibacteria group bacterium]
MAVRKWLKKGDNCPVVAVVQAVLTTNHFMWDGRADLDSEFGDGTEAGVRSFQHWAMKKGGVEGLVNDGEVGEKTFKAFNLFLGVNFDSLPDGFWPEGPQIYGSTSA